MTFDWEVSLTLTERTFHKLLYKASIIQDQYVKEDVSELLAKAEVYRNGHDNTILLYWKCVLWITQTEYALPAAVWIEDFLAGLNLWAYHLIKIEGRSNVDTAGNLASRFMPIQARVIDKVIDDSCERVVLGTGLQENVA